MKSLSSAIAILLVIIFPMSGNAAEFLISFHTTVAPWEYSSTPFPENEFDFEAGFSNINLLYTVDDSRNSQDTLKSPLYFFDRYYESSISGSGLNSPVTKLVAEFTGKSGRQYRFDAGEILESSFTKTTFVQTPQEPGAPDWLGDQVRMSVKTATGSTFVQGHHGDFGQMPLWSAPLSAGGLCVGSCGFPTSYALNGIGFEAWVGEVSVSQITSAVPEMSTWLMMLLGIGLIGSVMRQTSRQSEILQRPHRLRRSPHFSSAL